MPIQVGKIGKVRGRLELEGKLCPFCGWAHYFVLSQNQWSTLTDKPRARCSKCGRITGVASVTGAPQAEPAILS